MKNLFSWAMAAAMVFGLASCSKDNTLETGNYGTNAALQFTVKTQKGSLVTRAIAEGEEWTVNGIDIYAFDSNGDRIATTADFTVSGNTYTATNDFVTTYAGQNIEVFFVGNPTANKFAATSNIDPSIMTKAAFIEQVTAAQTVTATKAALLGTPLLFSASEAVAVPASGKKQVDVKLKRREARFDIQYSDGTVPVPSSFAVKQVIIKDAKIQGYVFADATQTATIATSDLADITTNAAGSAFAFDADRMIKSAFYMYPTQLGSTATSINILAEVGGVEQLFEVKSNMAIVANMRYILRFNPAALQFLIEAADYDGDEIVDMAPSTPGLIGFSTTGTGLLTNNTYELIAGQNATLTVNLGAASAQGFNVTVSGTNGVTTQAAIAATQNIGSLTRSSAYYPVEFSIPTTYATSVAGTEVIVTFADKTSSNNSVSVILWDGVDASKFSAESNSYMVTPGSAMIYIPVSRAYKFWNDNTNFTNAADLAADAAFASDFLWTDVAAGMAANGAVKNIYAIGKGENAALIVEPGTAEGNAVVAVTNGGEIKWSWHIWVVEDAATIEAGVGTGNKWMDRNIGALINHYDATREADVMGFLYQFGRKDPLPARNGFTTPNSITTKTLYNHKGDIIDNVSQNGVKSLAFIIENPLGFIVTESMNWTNENTGEHTWNDPNYSKGSKHKSLFDPSPVGWKLPIYGDWSGVGTWNSWNNYGLINIEAGGYYPAVGHYTRTSGNLNGAGVHGYYQTSSPNGPSDGWFIDFSPINVTNYGNRAHAFSVRCVKVE